MSRIKPSRSLASCLAMLAFLAGPAGAQLSNPANFQAGQTATASGFNIAFGALASEAQPATASLQAATTSGSTDRIPVLQGTANAFETPAQLATGMGLQSAAYQPASAFDQAGSAASAQSAAISAANAAAPGLAPVKSVAGRTGALTLTHADLTDWSVTLQPYALSSSLGTAAAHAVGDFDAAGAAAAVSPASIGAATTGALSAETTRAQGAESTNASAASAAQTTASGALQRAGGQMIGDIDIGTRAVFNASTSTGFELRSRLDTVPYPVPSLRPTSCLAGGTACNLALDLDPIGSPGNLGGTNGGVTWLDICNADFIASGTSTVGACLHMTERADGSAIIGTQGYNGAPAGPTTFIVNNIPMLNIAASGLSEAGAPLLISGTALGDGVPIEPAATNLLLQSGTPSASPWTASSATVTASGAADPFGGTTTYAITKTTSALASARQSVTIAANTATYCASAYYNTITSTAPVINLLEVFSGGSGFTANLQYNVSTGALTGTGGATATMTPVPQAAGWYRLVACAPNDGTETALSVQLRINDATATSYTFVVAAPQLEATSYATSYIPTGAAAATRPAGTGATAINASALRAVGLAPALTGFGTSPTSPLATDVAGTITVGPSPGTTGAVTFVTVRTNKPTCTVTRESGAAIAYSDSTSGISMTTSAAMTAGELIDYVCFGH